MNQTQINKPPIIISITNRQYLKQIPLTNSMLMKKYSLFHYSYSNIQINNLIFNEKSNITSHFKDYLIIDDNTEFLRRYYSKKEYPSRLSRIYSFYSTYSKIFPNYMILPESKHLYRNIRKKQRMIDAFNQIKREEEENRLNLNIEKKNCKGGLVIFNKTIERSIGRYELSHTGTQTGIEKEQSKTINVNEEDMTIDSFSVSISHKRLDLYNDRCSSRIMMKHNESNASIAYVIQLLSNNNNNAQIGNLNEHLIATPKKDKKIINYDTVVPSTKPKDEKHTLSALNNNRKFISHKLAVSNPEVENSKMHIINNYHNIILPESSNTIININTNKYQCSTNKNDKVEEEKNPSKAQSKSIKIKKNNNKELNDQTQTTVLSSLKQKSYFKNISIRKASINKVTNTEVTLFKSPEKALLCTDPIETTKTKTINTHKYMIPFFKTNKRVINTMTELQNKINPFKLKFDKRKHNQLKDKQASISSTSINKKSIDIQTAKKKDIKISLPTETSKDKSNMQNTTEHKITKEDMKNRYKVFIENAKKEVMTFRNSCESSKKQSTTTSDTLSKFKASKMYSIQSTQKQQQFSKISIQKKLLFSPKPIIENYDYNTTTTPFNHNNETKGGMTTQIKLTHKVMIPFKTNNTKDRFLITTNAKLCNNSNGGNTGIKSINFKALNPNTTSKMKFIKR